MSVVYAQIALCFIGSTVGHTLCAGFFSAVFRATEASIVKRTYFCAGLMRCSLFCSSCSSKL
jgi:hypothetical protein